MPRFLVADTHHQRCTCMLLTWTRRGVETMISLVAPTLNVGKENRSWARFCSTSASKNPANIRATRPIKTSQIAGAASRGEKKLAESCTSPPPRGLAVAYRYDAGLHTVVSTPPLNSTNEPTSMPEGALGPPTAGTPIPNKIQQQKWGGPGEGAVGGPMFGKTHPPK